MYRPRIWEKIECTNWKGDVLTGKVVMPHDDKRKATVRFIIGDRVHYCSVLYSRMRPAKPAFPNPLIEDKPDGMQHSVWRSFLRFLRRNPTTAG
jgi:hypothetical protein